MRKGNWEGCAWKACGQIKAFISCKSCCDAQGFVCQLQERLLGGLQHACYSL